MRTRYLLACGLAAIALPAAGCGGEGTETATFSVDAPPAESAGGGEGAGSGSGSGPEATTADKPNVQVPSGPPPKQLQTRDLEEGSGPAAKEGDEVSVNYVGVAYSTGEEFDSSYGSGGPFTFTLGEGEVIPGWDEGVAGMKAGGRRKLIIPPGQAYGAQGSPPDIGPNETLVFVVDLVSID